MRPHPRRTITDPTHPDGWATSDRSGFIGNHKNLRWQMAWAGTEIINTRVLVWGDEYDIPNRQDGTIILPPDPPSLANARPEQYPIDENPVSTRYTLDGLVRAILPRAAYPQLRIASVQGNLTTS